MSFTCAGNRVQIQGRRRKLHIAALSNLGAFSSLNLQQWGQDRLLQDREVGKDMQKRATFGYESRSAMQEMR